jgi:MscS family membrane protein
MRLATLSARTPGAQSAARPRVPQPHAWRWGGLVFVVSLAVLGSRSARADDTEAAGAGQEVPDSATSPRSALEGYLDACRRGDYDSAATYLDLPDSAMAQGATLARHLKAVVDRYVWFDLDSVSGLPSGNVHDGLPPDLERLGQIPGRNGPAESLLMRQAIAAKRWVFTRATVQKIELWYGQLDEHWIFDHLPSPLLRPGPKDLLWGQWLALCGLLALAWPVGAVLARLSSKVLGRVVARTSVTWDDRMLERVGGPLRAGWCLAIVYLLLPRLALYQPAERFMQRCLRIAVVLISFWALLRAVNTLRQLVARSQWAQEHASLRSLLPLTTRVAEVLVVALGFVTLATEFGYSVTSLIAGLGIGGLAVALGAQKTLENFFGAVSIGADQPFREGDFVRIGELIGTVEAIGLRSTRIRTLDRTLVSIPNGKLADMQLETFAARDRIRLACDIGLVYSTTSTQLRSVLTGLERVLREHPKIWPDVIVRFKAFGDSALIIEVMAWFQTQDWGEFMLLRQDTLLHFMEVVETAGTQFAFPTRTVHLVTTPPQS